MSAASWALWCLLAAGSASAQPADPACTAVEGLAPERVRQLHPATRCRLDTDARWCMPGLSLAVDVNGDRDLCLSRDGRPAQRPRCAHRFARRYRQALYGRVSGVREPQGTPTTVVVKHSEVTRIETMVQRDPLVRPGPDGCAFARTPRMDFAPPKTKIVPAPAPAEAP